MFTIEQIQTAHARVKSGADFPRYVQDLIALGVTHYHTFLEDGHTAFYGSNGYNRNSPAKYPQLTIATSSNDTQFQQDLKAHQQGHTDYLTFCRIAANHGVEKWIVDMSKMTCTYYNKAGREVLVETIPTP
jgi:uncharacterized protein YbcV (DUF1398 family)